MRLLILGGTTEASASGQGISPGGATSTPCRFAGRTQNPVAPQIPFRSGGFGGVDGLKSYLTDEKIDLVVDATHPFAAQMSAHAAEACRDLGLAVAMFTRAPWRAVPGDRWVQAADMKAATAAALGDARRDASS